MKTSTPSSAAARILQDERKMAAQLGISYYTLQKDRQTKRLYPYVKVGGQVRYDPVAVFAAVDATQQGGSASQRKEG